MGLSDAGIDRAVVHAELDELAHLVLRGDLADVPVGETTIVM
jgi:hypothetical protein